MRRGQRTRTYVIWVSMRQRCLNPKSWQYRYYGARGITVCPEWDSFGHFLADMGEAPHGLTLERRNNDLSYSKSNCYWASRKAQAQNTRRTRNVTYKGATHCIAEWSRITGTSDITIAQRLDRGWAVGRALGYQRKLTLRELLAS